MENVNKQLLDALVGMVGMWKTTCDAMNWEPDHLAEYDIARQAISAAEQAQQAEPRCACGDSFTRDAVCANCLAAAPQAAVAAPLPPYNVFSDDDGDSWREHPADADFVEGLQLGEEFELLAGWRSVRVTFRVTKVPDGENDDYEVEEVTATAAQKGGQ